MPDAPRLISMAQLKTKNGYTLVEGPDGTMLVPKGVKVLIEDESKCIPITQTGDGLNRVYYDPVRKKLVDAMCYGQAYATEQHRKRCMQEVESYANSIGHPLPPRDPTCLACRGRHLADSSRGIGTRP